MSSWTTILDAWIDRDSPWHAGLVTDFRDNIAYNSEHATRTGTNAAGVRLAYARGRTAFTVTIDGSGDGASTVTITYATDALDGDPNFLSSETPVFTYNLEQDGTGSAWSSFYAIAWNTGIQHFITTRADADETVAIQINIANSSDTSATVKGWVNWRADAIVASGE